jgi:hypothetical protein
MENLWRNVGFWKKQQATAYDEAVALVKNSHAEVMALIESLSGEELFEKKHFPWTGTTSIGSCRISAAPSHYGWAMKKIKQWSKGEKERKR